MVAYIRYIVVMNVFMEHVSSSVIEIMNNRVRKCCFLWYVSCTINRPINLCVREGGTNVWVKKLWFMKPIVLTNSFSLRVRSLLISHQLTYIWTATFETKTFHLHHVCCYFICNHLDFATLSLVIKQWEARKKNCECTRCFWVDAEVWNTCKSCIAKFVSFHFPEFNRGKNWGIFCLAGGCYVIGLNSVAVFGFWGYSR